MKKSFMYKVMTLILVFTCVSGGMMYKASENPYYDDVYKKYADSLNTQKEMQLETWAGYMYRGMYQEYYDLWICSGALGDGKVIEILLDEGYYVEYFDEIKAAGLISPDYQLPASSKTQAQTTISSASTPEPVTTEKCEEKIMWAKSTVNIREHGSTAYTKTGSLKKDEQVTVIGIDSTGWYEIRTADGTVGHVSDKYLTEVDPSVSNAVDNTKNDSTEDSASEDAVPSAIPTQESYIISIEERTVTWFNAETREEEVVEFDENIPLDQIEDCANRFLLNREDYIASPTPELTVEPSATPEPTIVPSTKPQSTVEPTVTPTPEVSLVHQITNSIWFVIFGFGLGIVCIVLGFVWWKKK